MGLGNQPWFRTAPARLSLRVLGVLVVLRSPSVGFRVFAPFAFSRRDTSPHSGGQLEPAADGAGVGGGGGSGVGIGGADAGADPLQGGGDHAELALVCL